MFSVGDFFLAKPFLYWMRIKSPLIAKKFGRGQLPSTGDLDLNGCDMVPAHMTILFITAGSVILFRRHRDGIAGA